MNKKHKNHPIEASGHINIISLQGDITRRVGNIRSVVLKTQTKAVDEVFGTERVMQDSIGDLFATKPKNELHNDNHPFSYLRRS